MSSCDISRKNCTIQLPGYNKCGGQVTHILYNINTYGLHIAMSHRVTLHKHTTLCIFRDIILHKLKIIVYYKYVYSFHMAMLITPSAEYKSGTSQGAWLTAKISSYDGLLLEIHFEIKMINLILNYSILFFYQNIRLILKLINTVIKKC